ncbi:MAG: hypothetical protein CMJ18_00890 [Phycisphaeraceae bacterium]|nr:hypothetical protein [Phycisphaeraceae bacterium]
MPSFQQHVPGRTAVRTVDDLDPRITVLLTRHTTFGRPPLESIIGAKRKLDWWGMQRFGTFDTIILGEPLDLVDQTERTVVVYDILPPEPVGSVASAMHLQADTYLIPFVFDVTNLDAMLTLRFELRDE